VIVRYRSHLGTSIQSRLRAYGLDSQAVRERVLIVGSGRTAEHIAWLLDHPTYSGRFQVVGLIDDDLFARGMKIYGAKVVGGIDDILRIVEQRNVGMIILADHRMQASQYHGLHEAIKKTPARVFVMPDIFGWLNKLDEDSEIHELAGNWVDSRCQSCLGKLDFVTRLEDPQSAQKLDRISN
jgi:FlaA1/EpsC-like NDP-sugar epimerase